MRGFRQKLRNLRVGPNKTTSTPESDQNIGSLAPATTAETGSFGNPQPQRSEPLQLESASQNQAVSPLPEQTIRLQCRIWNNAYDELKSDEASIVDAYERILSGQLTSGVTATEVEGYPGNAMETASARQDRMRKLIEDGQIKTEKVATIKGKIKDVLEPFNQLRSVIALAVKSEPTASTAWGGITAILDVFAHLVAWTVLNIHADSLLRSWPLRFPSLGYIVKG
ncbi:hypothetical protein B0I35DRAFT_63761 [Stachybotrys elegans]|uniref:NWD NACHT-NTPase N-terminal domain-containing protein n=1 Tax=Stachybotrys elegans TaxID=80388 RepID=A0A8K0SL08_9HYPO|nr:hypothetical protein B0I35DRAFT_63761 [Stachybotrys elegans]